MEISQIELDGKIIRLEVTLWSSLGYIPREVNWIPRIECKYVECNNGYLSITDEEILQGEIQLKYDSEQIFLKFQMNFSEINDYRQILLHFCVENRLLYHYVYSTILYPLFSSRLDKRIACNCLRSLCCNFLPLITFLPGAQSDLIRKQFSLYIRLLMGYHFPKLLIRLDSINPKWHHFVVSAEDFDSTNKNNAHNAKTNLETINNTDKSNQYNSLYPYQNQNHSTSSSHVDEKNTAINSIYDRAFHEDKEDSFLVSNVAEKNSSESLSDSDYFRREEALEAHIFHNLSLDEESHGAGYGGEIEHDDGGNVILNIYILFNRDVVVPLHLHVLVPCPLTHLPPLLPALQMRKGLLLMIINNLCHRNMPTAILPSPTNQHHSFHCGGYSVFSAGVFPRTLYFRFGIGPYTPTTLIWDCISL